MGLSDDDRVRAIRWALGVPVYPDDEKLWRRFVSEQSSLHERELVARSLGHMFERVALLLMGIRRKGEGVETWERRLVERVLKALTKESVQVAKCLMEALTRARTHPASGQGPGSPPAPLAAPPGPPPERTGPPQLAKLPRQRLKLEGGATFPSRRAGPPGTGTPIKARLPTRSATPGPSEDRSAMDKDVQLPPPIPHARTDPYAPTLPSGAAAAAGSSGTGPVERPSGVAAEEKAAAGTTGVPAGAALWSYVAVPPSADRHADSYETPPFLTLKGFRLVGARARGRKHKHDGTNCDDWFEAALHHSWSLVAVADGAGSCRLSRIGARISTAAAIASLRRNLPDALEGRADWSPAALERAPDRTFKRTDLQQVQVALHDAMHAAQAAVADEARRRDEDLKAFSGTLRLAVHSRVPHAGEGHSLVMACNVGDGMTAAIEDSGELKLLGTEESSGKYSGETEFLTDQALDPARLAASTYPWLGPLRVLMVMTDGVADPYFPNHPGLLRLYADLVLNGVIRDATAQRGAADDTLASRDRAPIDLDTFSYVIDSAVGPGEKQRVRIRQSDRYASVIGKALEEVVSWPPRELLAGCRGELMTDLAARSLMPERLRIWLDAFYVRGEFDDRTLVLLQRDAVP